MAALTDQLMHTDLPGADGLLAARSATAVLSNGRSGEALKADTSGCVLGVDFTEGRRFGTDPSITGLEGHGDTPTGDQTVINERLAHSLDLQQGDDLTVYAYGQQHRFTVDRVVPEVGLAGYCGAMVAPSAISEMATPLPAGAQPPAGLVWISNRGGVFDSTAATTPVMSTLRSTLASTKDVAITASKRDTLDERGATGQEPPHPVQRHRWLLGRGRDPAVGQPVRDARRGAQGRPRDAPRRRA